LKDLLAVQKVSLPGALLGIITATTLGAIATHCMGWSWTAGIVFGMSISVASTVVLTRVLSDNKVLHTPGGHIALGWLVAEDLFTILALGLLPVIINPDGGNMLTTIGVTLAEIALLIVLMLWVGPKLLPLALTWIARTGTRDLFTLAILVIALGIAAGAAYFFNVSMALGAFLGGMVVGQSEFSARATAEALPMRDAFAVLFFVSIGMQLDPHDFVNQWKMILIILGIVMICKPLLAFLLVLGIKRSLRLSLVVSLALAQIGEFSFILAGLALNYKVFGQETLGAIIIASVISIILNPIIYKRIPPILKHFENIRFEESFQNLTSNPQDKEQGEACLPVASDAQRVIVVGYGPVGRSLARILQDNHVEVVVIEMNINTVQNLRNQKIMAIHGDATKPQILKLAGIEQAQGLILSSMVIEAKDVIECARSINPNIHVTVYTFYLKKAQELRQFNNVTIISGEESAAVMMSSGLMRVLGASEEQIAEEERRIELSFGSNADITPIP
jgi:CPA2 family monovalent cation:H+ antiporter-2